VLSKRALASLLLALACLLLPGCKEPLAPPAPPADPFAAASPGERIFVQGVGHDGPLERTDVNGALVTAGSSCAECHGKDGRGTEEAPPIDLKTLRARRETPKHTSALDTGPRLILVHEGEHDGDEEKKPSSKPGDEPDTETTAPEAPLMIGPWTDAQVLDVIQTGRTPEGFKLTSEMPRWKLDEIDGAALLEHLGTL